MTFVTDLTEVSLQLKYAAQVQHCDNSLEVTGVAPTIRVDDEVYKSLQAQAVPFQDTPNSVLRRVLDLPQGADPFTDVEPKPRRSGTRSKRSRQPVSPSQRAPRGSILAESEYELPLLQAIAELGGSAGAAEVLRVLEPKIVDRLTALDLELLPSGRIRWHNRAQFARLSLVRRGELDPESPRGTWQITEAGRARL